MSAFFLLTALVVVLFFFVRSIGKSIRRENRQQNSKKHRIRKLEKGSYAVFGVNDDSKEFLVANAASYEEAMKVADANLGSVSV